MKQTTNSTTSLLVAAWIGLAAVPLRLPAQTLSASPLPAPVMDESSGAAAVVERGPNYQVVKTASGGVYTHLACGLNYYGKDGQLMPAQEVITIRPDGYGVADQGQHSATFAPSVIDLPAVQHLADGKTFQSRILGLVYFDRASGKSTLFSVPKDSIGAWSRVTASCTQTPSRMESIATFDILTSEIRYHKKSLCAPNSQPPQRRIR